ncbi:YeeE/YedE family protein [Pseudoduganella sp. FT26W]|uniref:YeeE/YedE family protein n=1 Tax=Duganella aquatilis TaxID=2666082 RepID=A0A844DE11_9BURK|nr:YeeE/YedE family protein [Duganella aquatilis]MRW87522.1 YeeE/YedE family protein [Duganella aquatilis]
MYIDWSHFTPWTALAGGLLIGVSVALLILFNGRVAGISGILGGLLRPVRRDIGWRIAFLAGLVIAPLVYGLYEPLPTIHIQASTIQLVCSGLLVGIGTRYGAGCTSGHGVCGLSRRSPRSFVATAAFMLAGFVAVYILRHVVL